MGEKLGGKGPLRFARSASALTMLIGLAGLLGWIFNLTILKSGLPNLAPIKISTAVLFVVAGASVWLQVEWEPGRRKTLSAQGLAVLVCIVSTVTLLLYAAENAGGAQRDLPGWARMAPNTAFAFLLAGISLFLQGAKDPRFQLISRALPVVVLIIGFLALTGYALGVNTLVGIAGYTSMAVPAAFGFATLPAGILASRPHRGVAAILAQDTPAGSSARRLVPILLILPLTLGWLGLRGLRAGLYGPEFATALQVTSGTIIISALVLWHARVQGAASLVKEATLRDQRFLVQLGDLLRVSETSSDVLYLVSKSVGEYLRVSRCLFGEIDIANDQATVRRDYHDGVPSLAGTQTLSSYSPLFRDEARAGRTVVTTDARLDSRIEPKYLEAYLLAGIRGNVGVPLLRNGQWVSTFFVSTQGARDWQPREVSLIQSVADRTWLWFEHLVALEALRLREQDLAVTMSSIGDAIITTDAKGRTLQMNPVAEKMTGWKISEAVTLPLHQVFHILDEGTRAIVESPVDRVLREGTVVGLANHTILVSRDGSEQAISNSAAPICERDGLIRGVVLVFRDSSVERAAAKALSESEARKTAMLNSALDAIVSIDDKGIVVEFNPAAERLFGFSRQSAMGNLMADLIVPPQLREAHRRGFQRYLQTGDGPILGKVVELPAMRADGSEFPAEIAITRVKDQQPRLFTAFIRDVTERRHAQAQERVQALNTELELRVRVRTSELSVALKEREVLLQEVHHRVKNNLQVISSLINMQVRQVTDPSVRRALEECKTRIQAIALIHEKLYQFKDYARVPFSEYVRSLAGNIFHATGVSQSTVALVLKIETLSLAVDKAIPCGLILNELITNALKHAFPDGRPGEIQVVLRAFSDRELLLAVQDDGVGGPANVNLDESSTLGMQLVNTLVEQLDGKLEIVRAQGMSFTIIFPAEVQS